MGKIKWKTKEQLDNEKANRPLSLEKRLEQLEKRIAALEFKNGK